MNIRCSWWASVVILALLVSVLGGCTSGEGDESEGEIEIVTVQRGSLVTSTAATGSILPHAEVMLSFEIAGRTSDVQVQAGDRVEQGQVLVQLDTSDLALQVRSAEAALAAVQAQLDQLKTGARPEEVTITQAQLEAAQAALAQVVAQRDRLTAGATDAEIAAAQAQVAAAQAEQLVAFQSHDETMRCHEITLPNGATKDICPGLGKMEEQARYALHAADEALAAAQAQLDALLAGEDNQISAAEAAVWASAAQRDVAQAQLDMLMTGATKAEMATAEANVAQAQVALDSAQLTLEKATLRAPFDGVIARVDVEPGESVSPQMPAIILVDDSLFRIEADVDEADIGLVEVGQEVQITLDAFPGHGLTGSIAAIAPSARLDMGVVSYLVTMEIKPTNVPLRGGMTANTEIIRERREGVLLVPNRAIWIDADTGQPFVEKLVDGEAVIAVIEQGVANEQVSEVLGGLTEGDQLAVRSVSIRERFRDVVTGPMTGQ